MDIICRWRDESELPIDYSGIIVWREINDGVSVFQWLDITDEPAVATSKVQAAVDEIQKWDSVEGILCNIEKHTGVTPSGVKESLTTETDMSDVQCPVCGYYCLGKGGAGCIDKPSMVTP